MPVIGILTQTLEPGMEGEIQAHSYIMAAYVRYIESFGARVVPILTNESNDETLIKLKGLNGVLFPGGGGDYL